MNEKELFEKYYFHWKDIRDEITSWKHYEYNDKIELLAKDINKNIKAGIHEAFEAGKAFEKSLKSKPDWNVETLDIEKLKKPEIIARIKNPDQQIIMTMKDYSYIIKGTANQTASAIFEELDKLPKNFWETDAGTSHDGGINLDDIDALRKKYLS